MLPRVREAAQGRQRIRANVNVIYGEVGPCTGEDSLELAGVLGARRQYVGIN